MTNRLKKTFKNELPIKNFKKNNNNKFKTVKFSLDSTYDVVSDDTYLDRIDQLLDDLVRLVNEELSLVTRNLVVFGSYAKYKKNLLSSIDLFIPGESDIDIALIVDTSLTEDPTKGLQNVVESLNSILFEPIYAPILDLSILEADIDLPPAIGSNFNLLHLHGVLSSGIVLWGKEENLNKFKYNKHDLQLASLSEVSKIYSDLKNAYLHRDMYRVPELFWLGVDSVLLSALTYSNYLKYEIDQRSLVKLEIADFLNKQDIPEHLKTIAELAIDFTLHGGPPDGHFEYFVDSLRFCRQINKLLK